MHRATWPRLAASKSVRWATPRNGERPSMSARCTLARSTTTIISHFISVKASRIWPIVSRRSRRSRGKLATLGAET